MVTNLVPSSEGGPQRREGRGKKGTLREKSMSRSRGSRGNGEEEYAARPDTTAQVVDVLGIERGIEEKGGRGEEGSRVGRRRGFTW